MTPESPNEFETWQLASSIEDGWLTVIRVRGDLDIYRAPELNKAFIDALETGMRWFLLDLLQVDYMDGAGHSLLIGCAKRAEDHSGELAVVCDHPQLIKVFEVSGAKEFLNVCPTIEEARTLLETKRDACEDEQGVTG